MKNNKTQQFSKFHLSGRKLTLIQFENERTFLNKFKIRTSNELIYIHIFNIISFLELIKKLSRIKFISIRISEHFIG